MPKKDEIKTRRACSQCQGSFDQLEMIKAAKQWMCKACNAIYEPKED